MTPTIALLGDVMLGRAVAERLADVQPEEVWAPEVRELCQSCDLVICNLECCISARGEPTERVRQKPFFFRGPPQAVRSLAAIGVGVVGLANNHALDYEVEALIETLELLGEAGIAVAGAGRDEPEARRAAIVEAGAFGWGWWPSRTTRASSRPAGTRRGSPTATCGAGFPTGWPASWPGWTASATTWWPFPTGAPT